jgi:hypothetical protein
MMTSDELRGPLGVSLAALTLIVIVLIWLAVPMSGTIAALSGGTPPNQSLHARSLTDQLERDQLDRNRVHGRSFFFDPAEPPTPPAPESTGACCLSETDCQVLQRSECSAAGGSFKGPNRNCSDDTCKPRVAPPPPPPTPSGPSRYGGPDLVMVWGSDAIFKVDGSLLIIPRGHMLEEVEVVSIDAPRTVTVNWRGGGPFELDLYPADVLPASNSTVTDSLLDGRDRPHVPEARPARATAFGTRASAQTP